MYLDNTTANDKYSIANLFADNFQKMFSDSTGQVDVSLLPQYNTTLSNIYISRKEIETSLNNLSSTLGPGPDSIPGIFVKNCIDSLIEPLFVLV